MSGVPVTFRVTYARYGELRDDIAQQMARGGLLVKVHDTPEVGFDSPVALELVLPDGTILHTAGKVLQVFSGYGIAVSVEAQVVEEVGRLASRPDVARGGDARHERVDAGAPRGKPISRPPVTRTSATRPPPLAAGSSPAMSPPSIGRSSPAITPPPSTGRSSPAIAPPPATSSDHDPPARPEGPSRMEKVQLALHGNRDERNAILRDRDRTLHAFVLKNPQLDADDVVAIAKNPQMASEMLKQLCDRKDWFQRPSVALALARNPKTPPELAVRALDFLPIEALRQMAKGAGVPPHVTQAARKKLLG
jgi:hypothetical protein